MVRLGRYYKKGSSATASVASRLSISEGVKRLRVLEEPLLERYGPVEKIRGESKQKTSSFDFYHSTKVFRRNSCQHGSKRT